MAGLQRAPRLVLGDRAGPGTGFLCPQRPGEATAEVFHSSRLRGATESDGPPTKPAHAWAFPAGMSCWGRHRGLWPVPSARGIAQEALGKPHHTAQAGGGQTRGFGGKNGIIF